MNGILRHAEEQAHQYCGPRGTDARPQDDRQRAKYPHKSKQNLEEIEPRMSVTVRLSDGVPPVAAGLERELQAIDPSVPVFGVQGVTRSYVALERLSPAPARHSTSRRAR